MKILKYIFLLILLIVVAGAIYIATLENSYDVSRTKVINAPAQVIFNNINDFKNWPSWSPWIEQEPAAQLTYADKTSGVGASYSWNGEILGEGEMETIDLRDGEFIGQKIKFVIPFESESDIYWNLKPVEEGTEVTWSMKGNMDFMFKAFAAFTGGMDKQIGPDYERGLFKLDSVLQAEMKRYSIEVNGITTRGGGYYLYTSTSCKIDEMAEVMQELMNLPSSYVQKNNIPLAGAPFTLYHNFDVENNAVMFSCAVPVSERVITAPNSGVLTGMIYPFKAVKATLKGDYDNLKEAWDTTYKYLADNNLEAIMGKPAVEVYIKDPMTTPNPAEWITEIYVPIKE